MKDDLKMIPISVIPAKAGIHLAGSEPIDGWVSAFAGTRSFHSGWGL